MNSEPRDILAHFGRYEAVKELGRSGRAYLWEAWDPLLERVVMVAVLGDVGASEAMAELRDPESALARWTDGQYSRADVLDFATATDQTPFLVLSATGRATTASADSAPASAGVNGGSTAPRRQTTATDSDALSTHRSKPAARRPPRNAAAEGSGRWAGLGTLGLTAGGWIVAALVAALSARAFIGGEDLQRDIEVARERAVQAGAQKYALDVWREAEARHGEAQRSTSEALRREVVGLYGAASIVSWKAHLKEAEKEVNEKRERAEQLRAREFAPAEFVNAQSKESTAHQHARERSLEAALAGFEAAVRDYDGAIRTASGQWETALRDSFSAVQTDVDGLASARDAQVLKAVLARAATALKAGQLRDVQTSLDEVRGQLLALRDRPRQGAVEHLPAAQPEPVAPLKVENEVAKGAEATPALQAMNPTPPAQAKTKEGNADAAAGAAAAAVPPAKEVAALPPAAKPVLAAAEPTPIRIEPTAAPKAPEAPLKITEAKPENENIKLTAGQRAHFSLRASAKGLSAQWFLDERRAPGSGSGLSWVLRTRSKDAAGAHQVRVALRDSAGRTAVKQWSVRVEPASRPTEPAQPPREYAVNPPPEPINPPREPEFISPPAPEPPPRKAVSNEAPPSGRAPLITALVPGDTTVALGKPVAFVAHIDTQGGARSDRTTCRWSVDGRPQATETLAGGGSTCRWNFASVTSGPHEVEVAVNDGAGRETRQTRTVTVAVETPDVEAMVERWLNDFCSQREKDYHRKQKSEPDRYPWEMSCRWKDKRISGMLPRLVVSFVRVDRLADREFPVPQTAQLYCDRQCQETTPRASTD